MVDDEEIVPGPPAVEVAHGMLAAKAGKARPWACRILDRSMKVTELLHGHSRAPNVREAHAPYQPDAQTRCVIPESSLPVRVRINYIWFLLNAIQL